MVGTDTTADGMPAAAQLGAFARALLLSWCSSPSGSQAAVTVASRRRSPTRRRPRRLWHAGLDAPEPRQARRCRRPLPRGAEIRQQEQVRALQPGPRRRCSIELRCGEDKYRVVLATRPDVRARLFNLAIIRKGKGDDAEAISLYRRIVAAAPKNAGAHMNLGLLLRSHGSKVEGNAQVRQALLLDPKLKDPAAG